MRRIVLPTILFAALAVAAVAVLAWYAHRSVRLALEGEFVRRIESVASTTAAQVDGADVRAARLLGPESTGYLALLVQLEGLCATPATLSVSVIDSTGAVVFDCRSSELEGAASPLETVAGGGLASALAGRAGVTPVVSREGRPVRIAFAPIHDHGTPPAVAGVLAFEVDPTYLAQLDGLRRQLGVITLVIALALLVLAAAAAQRGLAAARLERRLTRSENLAAMGRLTATLAHEIKNPLAIIRGSAKRLGKLDAEAQRMADSVVEEVDRLTATVTRYLQFARIEGGPEAADGAGGGDARAALDVTLALLEGECAARRCVLERRGTWPAAAPVRLDADSLKQIALNLVLNAVEAMADGGTLAVSLAEARGGFELRFEDSGPGIPADTLPRLGDPFVTTKAQGSGLGLFLTRRLAQSGGGTLAIESTVGRGTTCRVWLPRRRS